ncbi:MAG TPA: hypothetical protein P5307_08210 [Pirellulaceae bacterium]|nr:hypothetical protein [Pirellulaceae bacterium]
MVILLLTVPVAATEFELNGHKCTPPGGFTVEHIARQPLVDRPDSADFDERSRLYATESSDSDAVVKVQREQRSHRTMRLEDVNGDGDFDSSTVFADSSCSGKGVLVGWLIVCRRTIGDLEVD